MIRSRYRGLVLVLVLVLPAGAWGVDLGTAFTYQGRLVKDGTPVTSSMPHCDFTFGLWDEAAAGNPKGNSPQTATAVQVTDGLFTVSLDFGPAGIDGTARWLEIAVQCPGDASATTLMPRQELKPAPHALALPGLFTQQGGFSPNLIGGSPLNLVSDSVSGGTIAGGGQGGGIDRNQVTDDWGVVGGGLGNRAGDGAGSNIDAHSATVGGGGYNFAGGRTSTVGGGGNNQAMGDNSTVGGGIACRALGDNATVAGGSDNLASLVGGTVGGGESNTAGGLNAVVAGGFQNDALGAFSTVAGGDTNDATAQNTTVSGGLDNKASALSSTVPGGRLNEAGGYYSFAAGFRAKIRTSPASGDVDGDEGTFVWADSTDADFTSTGADQFLIRAGGGVGINTNSPTAHLTIDAGADGRPGLRVDNPGSVTGSVRIASGGGYPGVIGFAPLGNRRDIRFTDAGISLLTSGTASAPSLGNGLVISEFGFVGIGDVTPNDRLDVTETDNIVASFDRLGSDGTIIALQQASGTEGTISVSGTTVSYNAFTGSHYGWTDETIARGTLVMMTGDNRRRHDDAGSEPIYGIAASNVANESKCLGAYLGPLEPAQTASLENPHQIMAVGNGDMWVVDTGRNIAPGDYLISSDVTGHAMLDNAERFPVGYVIARASESVDWQSVTDEINGRKHKRISVFFESFERGSAVGLGRIVEEQQMRIDDLTRRLSAVEGGRIHASLALMGILGVSFGAAIVRRRAGQRSLLEGGAR